MYTRRQMALGMAATGAAMWLLPKRVLATPGHTTGAHELKGLGVAYRTIPVASLLKLRDDMEKVMTSGQVSDNPTFRSYIAERQYTAPDTIPDARSVVVMAVADQMYAVGTRRHGTTRDVLIAPGYTRDHISRDDMREFVLREVVGDEKAAIEPARLPLKLLAARTGLAEYGKNNITFVRGMGSFHRLAAFFVDRELPAATWRPLRALHECKGCSICIDRCPTQAIPKDRFVIDVGRCVTLYNELPDPMPEWMPANAHNALVGCLSCQLECPANAKVIGRVERLADLSEEETAMLLSGELDDELGKTVATKLARCGLAEDLGHLSRNLRLLLPA